MGIFELKKAIFFAKNRGYDLTLVSQNTQPPVAKLINWGKQQYRLEKLAAKQKKKKTSLKEIRLSMKISEHDLMIKSKKASNFLEKGHRVKVSLRLKGREMQFRDKAFEVLEKLTEDLKEIGEIEVKPYRERNQFIAQYKPK